MTLQYPTKCEPLSKWVNNLLNNNAYSVFFDRLIDEIENCTKEQTQSSDEIAKVLESLAYLIESASGQTAAILLIHLNDENQTQIICATNDFFQIDDERFIELKYIISNIFSHFRTLALNINQCNNSKPELTNCLMDFIYGHNWLSILRFCLTKKLLFNAGLRNSALPQYIRFNHILNLDESPDLPSPFELILQVLTLEWEKLRSFSQDFFLNPPLCELVSNNWQRIWDILSMFDLTPLSAKKATKVKKLWKIAFQDHLHAISFLTIQIFYNVIQHNVFGNYLVSNEISTNNHIIGGCINPAHMETGKRSHCEMKLLVYILKDFVPNLGRTLRPDDRMHIAISKRCCKMCYWLLKSMDLITIQTAGCSGEMWANWVCECLFIESEGTIRCFSPQLNELYKQIQDDPNRRHNVIHFIMQLPTILQVLPNLKAL